MSFAHHNAVRLYYELIGCAEAPAVLLLGGAGRQCIDFADPFCRALVERNWRVIRYDQRDTGLSTGFAQYPPDAAGVAAAVAEGREALLPYDIHALAADAVAVLDASGVKHVHLFGRSLGSAVAQVIALDYPLRVRSMTLAIAMSRGIGQVTSEERLKRLDAEQFTCEDSYAARQVDTARFIGNPDYFDAALVRDEAIAAYRRGIHPGGVARHFMVGLALPDLRPRLGELTCPVAVIHGRLDRVVPLKFGLETAAAIPGARLSILEDMAHEAPAALWERWIDVFAQNARRCHAMENT